MIVTPDFHSALAIGAHPDDVEFGCFGSLQRFAHRNVVLMSAGEAGGPADQRRSEAQAAGRVIDAEVEILGLPDTQLTTATTIDAIASAIDRIAPDVVFTMSAQDAHQDHATVGSASLVALRRFTGLVLTYPTPSLAPGRFAPQVFFELDDDQMDRKLEALACHRSQAHRHYLTNDYLETTARYWAHQAGGSFPWCEPFAVARWVEPADRS
jgi:LmbE family N-acetylglucosaminyl deacetylase